MTVETATYISDLNASYPAAGDVKSEGDDHLRKIKSVLKATLPAFDSALSASPAELDNVSWSFVNILNSGATGDGTTDDTTAVYDFGAAGGGWVPVGEYLHDATTVTDPASVLCLPGAIYENSGNSATSVEFQNSLTWIGGKVDGNTTVTLGTRSHVAHFLSAASSYDGVSIYGAEFTGLSYTFLKANTDATTQNRIKIAGNYFHDNFAVDLAFNSPEGTSEINDVLVVGNTFGANLGGQVTNGLSHRATAAGNVNNLRFVANHAEGVGNELWRSEEGARNIVVALNTAELSTRHGIQITDNNVGGTDRVPERFVIAGNALQGADTASSRGIELVNDASGYDPLRHSVVSGNVLSDWESGLRTARGAQYNLFAGNVIYECAYGIRATEPSVTLDEIMLTDCTTGVISERGGMFGKIHFRDTASETPTFATPMDGSGEYCSLTGWTWESGRFDITDAATTLLPMMPMGAMFAGTLKIHMYRDSGVRTIDISEVSYDGSTLYVTQINRVAAGAVQISSASCVVEDSGNLCVRIANTSGSALTTLRVQVSFDGIHVWA